MSKLTHFAVVEFDQVGDVAAANLIAAE